MVPAPTPTTLWIGSIVLGISLASIFPTAISLPQNLNVPVDGMNNSIERVRTEGNSPIFSACGIAFSTAVTQDLG